MSWIAMSVEPDADTKKPASRPMRVRVPVPARLALLLRLLPHPHRPRTIIRAQCVAVAIVGGDAGHVLQPKGSAVDAQPLRAQRLHLPVQRTRRRRAAIGII
ncbi:hypothetical protein LUR55_12175 [Luteimonas sp. C4P040a]|nr:hypothetical protein [Luteimonas fraxinea]